MWDAILRMRRRRRRIDVNGLGLTVGTLRVVNRWLLRLGLGMGLLRLTKLTLDRCHGRWGLMTIHLVGVGRYSSDSSSSRTAQVKIRRRIMTHTG